MQKKTYKVELTDRFKKEFRKLDKYTQKMLRAWINNNLIGCVDPRQHGKGLTGNRNGQWRYRVGDYRMNHHHRQHRKWFLQYQSSIVRHVHSAATPSGKTLRHT